MSTHETDTTALADTPEADAEAAKFSVPSPIHAGDFVYKFILHVHPQPELPEARAHATSVYFADGDRSARQLDDLIRRHQRGAAASGRLSLLEFASGYGMVTRHLAKMSDRYDVTACDIHPGALSFLDEALGSSGVRTVQSDSDPAAFRTKGNYDVVFALSFFSHMPDRTFRTWIEALLSALADGGLLIFTTHGRIAYEDVKRPTMEPDGHFFAPVSEQEDLPTDEYGCMIATPQYVTTQLGRCPDATLLAYEEGFWWGKQDVFVVRKVANEFRPQQRMAELDPEVKRLVAVQAATERQLGTERARVNRLNQQIESLHRSTSWRLTTPLRTLSRFVRRR